VIHGSAIRDVAVGAPLAQFASPLTITASPSSITSCGDSKSESPMRRSRSRKSRRFAAASSTGDAGDGKCVCSPRPGHSPEIATHNSISPSEANGDV
jgi:hypothetical protein